MIELDNCEVKVVAPGESLDITVPKPLQHIEFDAYKPGRYIVTVVENGDYMVREDGYL